MLLAVSADGGNDAGDAGDAGAGTGLGETNLGAGSEERGLAGSAILERSDVGRGADRGGVQDVHGPDASSA